jgi:hypothetical protein
VLSVFAIHFTRRAGPVISRKVPAAFEERVRVEGWGGESAGVQGPDGIDTAVRIAVPVEPRAARLLLPALFVAALLPLLFAPVLPLIDFYNHVMRFDVLTRLGSDPALAANYVARWALLPNIGLDAIAAGLLLFVPATALPHLLTILIMASIFVGVLAFNRAVAGSSPMLPALLLLPLLYNWVLNWGFANFLFGLGLSFAAAAAWVHWRPRPALRLAIAMPAAIIVFLCHGIAFALYGVLIAGLEIGAWWGGRQRAAGALVRALGLCLIQAIVPALLFLASRTAAAPGGLSNADSTVLRLWRDGGLLDRLVALAAHRLETIVRVAEGPSLLSDVLWTGGVILLLGWLWRGRHIRIAMQAWPAVAIAIVLVLLCPPVLFGIAYVADRMPLFLALLLVGSLRPGAGLSLRHPAVIGLAALIGLRLVSIGVQWHRTADELADLDRIAAALPPSQLLVSLAPGASPHDEVPRRCDMYLHVLALRHRQIVPLFAYATAQPIALTGRLAAARAKAELRKQSLPPTLSDASRSRAMMDAFADAGFDYVLLCKIAPETQLPLARYPIAAQSGRFLLLRTGGVP